MQARRAAGDMDVCAHLRALIECEGEHVWRVFPRGVANVLHDVPLFHRLAMAIAVIACRQANGAGWGAGHNTDTTLKAQRTHARRWNLNLRSMDWSKEISNSFAVSLAARLYGSGGYGFGPGDAS